MIAYLGLGSNLGNSFNYLQNALDALQKHTAITVLAYSDIYQSKPQGPQDQPDYLNAVVQIDTLLSAQQLLHCTQAIENKNLRQRIGQRWGARTLDIDILLYGNEYIQEEYLNIPHPCLCQRSFVLRPLYDIISDLNFPNGKTLQACLANCSADDLHKTTFTFTMDQ
jgi:2-amino-4-hydroxy-6-hydroxymethyldihydropteridine diphosphokinase